MGDHKQLHLLCSGPAHTCITQWVRSSLAKTKVAPPRIYFQHVYSGATEHQTFKLCSLPTDMHLLSAFSITQRTSDIGILYLHFAWVVDDAKCIVVTRVCVSVCVSVCLSVAVRPHYCSCTDPDVTWGHGRGCPLVVHCWTDLQSGGGTGCVAMAT